MMWAFVVVGYVIAVASIVRFFQFVSETDRSIDEFWISGGKISQLRGRMQSFRASTMKSSRRRGHTLRASKPQRA